MSDSELSDIEKKFKLLLKRMRSLHNENLMLVEKMKKKDAEIMRHQDLLEASEEKMQILKMTAPSDENEGEFRKEIHATINSYIKEIDGCIAILNK